MILYWDLVVLIMIIIGIPCAIFNSHIRNLTAIPAVVQENVPIVVVIKREKEELNITLIPKKWDGRGLLGCHLLPYTSN